MKALTLFLLLASIPFAQASDDAQNIILCDNKFDISVLKEEPVELSGEVVDISTMIINDASKEKEDGLIIQSEDELNAVNDLAKESADLLSEIAIQKEQQASEVKKEHSKPIRERASALLSATSKFFKRHYEEAKPHLQTAYAYTSDKLRKLGAFIYNGLKTQKQKVEQYIDNKKEDHAKMLAQRALDYKNFSLQQDQLIFDNKTYKSLIVKDANKLKTMASSKDDVYLLNDHRIAFVDQKNDELVWLDSLKLKALYNKDIVIANLRIASVKDAAKKEALKNDYALLNKQYQEITGHLSKDAHSAEGLIALHRLNKATVEFTEKLSELNSQERKAAAALKEQQIAINAQKPEVTQKPEIQTTAPESIKIDSKQKVVVGGQSYEVYDLDL